MPSVLSVVSADDSDDPHAMKPYNLRFLNTETASFLAYKLRTNHAAEVSSDEVPAVVGEYDRFLGIIAASKAGKNMPRFAASPPRKVDLCWHEHILHTQWYAKMCHAQFDRFVHHVPSMGKLESADTVAAYAAQYAATVARYSTLFGAAPPASIWPALNLDEDKCEGCGTRCSAGGGRCNTG
jgi:hypothetical protein